jgi:alkylation response protein AidB-like acyl-CoA dehydrogenase
MTEALHDDVLGDLRDSARRFLAPLRSLPAETSDGHDGPDRPEWWAQIAALGWTGLLAPEDAGGADAGAAAAAVIIEELAYQSQATPFIASAVLATRALALAGESAAARQWLPKLAGGSAVAATVVTGASGLIHRDGIGIRMEATANGEVRLEGTAHYVAGAAGADLLLLAATSPAGQLAIVAAEPARPGISVLRLRTHDRGHHLSHVTLRQLACPPESTLAYGPAAEAIFAGIRRDGLYALAADSLGTARRAFDLALAYAGQRHQFGRPIGSFQAIKHKLADMYLRLTGAAALLRRAAGALDAGDDESRTLVAVGSYVREAASAIAGDALQIHGAAGYTWEHECHWLLKRAKFNERYLATLWSERDRLAGLALDQPEAEG